MSWAKGLKGLPLKIVKTEVSPLRLVAGPGTGKTFVMNRKIAKLLEEGVRPRNILAVTFTRTAAINLIGELQNLGVSGCEDIRAGTLHSFCFSVLMREQVLESLGRIPRLIISFYKSGVLQFEGAPLLEDLKKLSGFGNRRECTKKIRAFEAAWARLQTDEPGWPQDPIDHKFHHELLQWLTFHKAMLVGELIPETLKYLRNNPRSKELRTFKHVFVDEYQDLNKAEQTIVDLLASNANNFIIGDPDQSIYRFRHAHPDGIINFSQQHPNTQDEELIECRRCPKRIVAIADSLIRNNYPGGNSPRLIPFPTNKEGEIYIVQWDSLEEEIEEVSTYIHYLVKKRKYSLKDILILCPRRQIGYQIRNKLLDDGVETHSFYHEELLEEKEAQIAFSFLNLLVDSKDRIALRFLLGCQSSTWLSNEYGILREYCEKESLTPVEVLEKIRLKKLRNLNKRYQIIKNRLLEISNLENEDLIDELFPSNEEWANVIREAISLYIKNQKCNASELLECLKTIIIQPEMPRAGDYLRIMSLQKSKGLTSKVVIIVGCINGLIPTISQNASTRNKSLEEKEGRRTFYVALTRAKELLIISSANKIQKKFAYQIGANVQWANGSIARTLASPFIGELGRHCPKPQDGRKWKKRGYSH